MAGAFHQISLIMDHLYLCGYPALNPDRIQHVGITNIINCSMDIPCPAIGRVSYTRVPVHDMPRSNLTPYFDKCADYINSVKTKGGKTLVHCMAGVSRSASICIVYLMKYYKMSLSQAYTFVRAKRHVIRPNQGFFKQMIDYEHKLFGKNSVNMINSPIGVIPDIYQKDIEGMVWLTHRDATPKSSSTIQPPRHNFSVTTTSSNTTRSQRPTGSLVPKHSALPPVVTPAFSCKTVFSARHPGTAVHSHTLSHPGTAVHSHTLSHPGTSTSSTNSFRYSTNTPAAKLISSSVDSYINQPGYKYVPRANTMYRSEPITVPQNLQPMTTYQLSYGATQKLF